MNRIVTRFSLLLWLLLVTVSPATAQFGGSRAGVEGDAIGVGDLPILNREVVEGFIAIDGRAEIRVKPTEIRIVLAVTSEAVNADECQIQIEGTIGKLKNAWAAIGVPADNIVEDFIAVLPQYAWEIEKDGDSEVGVEKKSGYRMQTNVHLSVPNDENASKVLAAAFKNGVTDIIAFDYWSKELDEIKVKARTLAVKAAKNKSETLLGELLEVVPPIVNVQEKTTIHFPDSLYHSFVNTNNEELANSWRREIPFIRAIRPRNTYYRGLNSAGDIQPLELPMKPEISVVSTVRLYFESPAAKHAKKSEDKR